ncbi:MAG TPA: aldo/keto reductase [Terriglobales bacterium]|nr:aldo/keto reductase [Terriglobales bacterium]
MIPGFATAEGTARYRQRFPQLAQAGHFRRPEHVPGAGELWLPSIGLGTYLGEPDDAGDKRYTEAIAEALRSGINLLDTAINYRHQRSERNIREALSKLMDAGVRRDEIVVCTKAGYLSFDGEMPADPRAYFLKEYVEPGTLKPQEVAGGMHCMAPKYLADQIERSRRNLGLETIDVFYVHNPESQLGEVPHEEFRKRLKAAFEMLEKAVAANTIRFYGTATWNAFRVPITEHEGMELAEVVELARQAGGEQHHFRFVQAPFNLGMPELFALRNQHLAKEPGTLLEIARRLGVAVVGSASLYQGHLTRDLPPFLGERLGMTSDSANAIQFARSAPGIACALIGMSRREHVIRNIEVGGHPPTPPETWEGLFAPR